MILFDVEDSSEGFSLGVDQVVKRQGPLSSVRPLRKIVLEEVVL